MYPPHDNSGEIFFVGIKLKRTNDAFRDGNGDGACVRWAFFRSIFFGMAAGVGLRGFLIGRISCLLVALLGTQRRVISFGC